MACAYDAAALRRPWTLGTRFPFWLCLPIAFPVYVLRAHGWWGALFLFVNFAMGFVLLLICVVTALSLGIPLPR
jgi:hypothetical protein